MEDLKTWTLALAFAALMPFAGCSPAVEYRPTLRAYEVDEDDEEAQEAEEEICEFRIFRGYVAEPYLVLGRVQLDTFAARALPETMAELREALTEEVCAAGGDGYFAVRNPTGYYSHGLIVRFLPEATPGTETETDTDTDTETETETGTGTGTGTETETETETDTGTETGTETGTGTETDTDTDTAPAEVTPDPGEPHDG